MGPETSERLRCQSPEQLWNFFRLCAIQMISSRDWYMADSQYRESGKLQPHGVQGIVFCSNFKGLN